MNTHAVDVISRHEGVIILTPISVKSHLAIIKPPRKGWWVDCWLAERVGVSCFVYIPKSKAARARKKLGYTEEVDK